MLAMVQILSLLQENYRFLTSIGNNL